MIQFLSCNVILNDMKHPVLLLFLILAPSIATSQSITNVRAAQRSGTKIVDVFYDLNSQRAALVELTISEDAGSTYSVPANTVIGQIGAQIEPGKNKHFYWDAGEDWNNKYSEQIKIRLIASLLGLAPSGFARIPGGTFQMGDTFAEGLGRERPVHSVYVSEFYIAQHETTRALFHEVFTWAQANGYSMQAVGVGDVLPDHPAQPNWFTAIKWCNARSEMEGYTPCYTGNGSVVIKSGNPTVVRTNWESNGYRLPTEAEWEKAARGGLIGKRFSWTSNIINHSFANFKNSGEETYQTGTLGFHPNFPPSEGTNPTRTTSPTGYFLPNNFGLYDMIGNLPEWCNDFGLRSYSGSDGISDPKGPSSGDKMAVRGGAWDVSTAQYERVAFRSDRRPDTSGGGIGFRVVRRVAVE